MRRIGLAFVLVVVIFLHRYEPSQWSSLATDILHSLHGPGFALLAAGFFYSLPTRFSRSQRFIFAGLAAIGVGILAELSQVPGPRNAEVADLIRNTVGAIAGLALVGILDPKTRKHISRLQLSAIIATCLLAANISIMPTLRSGFAYVMRVQAMPTLLSFEHSWEQKLLSQIDSAVPKFRAAPDDWPIRDSKVVRAKEAGRFGILLAFHPQPDWSAYSKMSFLAASSNGESATILVSIRDMRESQGHRSVRNDSRLEILPVAQRYAIEFADILESPDNAKFDFEHVESVILSAPAPGNDIGVLLDDFRLE